MEIKTIEWWLSRIADKETREKALSFMNFKDEKFQTFQQAILYMCVECVRRGMTEISYKWLEALGHESEQNLLIAPYQEELLPDIGKPIPGPYSVMMIRSKKGNIRYYISGNEITKFAKIYTTNDDQAIQSEKTAYLMAAAPELKEAVINLIELCKSSIGKERFEEYFEFIEAKKALQKCEIPY